mmetsp:Transcript_17015/g.14946  ORF Transcript_17015/g.14946 Transcript_17015/m.14946 type:complete len:248 (+) Transcript_17015:549-1292(+)
MGDPIPVGARVCLLEKNHRENVKKLKDNFSSKIQGHTDEVKNLQYTNEELRNKVEQLKYEKIKVNAEMNKLATEKDEEIKLLKNCNLRCILKLNRTKEMHEYKDKLIEERVTTIQMSKMIKDITKKLESKDKTIVSLKRLVESRDNIPSSRSQTSRSVSSESYYKKLYLKMKKEIIENLKCSITFETTKAPAITPSGHIVEEEVLERLVFDSSKDPFNNVDTCTQVIKNRFAVKLREILLETQTLEK